MRFVAHRALCARLGDARFVPFCSLVYEIELPPKRKKVLLCKFGKKRAWLVLVAIHNVYWSSEGTALMK